MSRELPDTERGTLAVRSNSTPIPTAARSRKGVGVGPILTRLIDTWNSLSPVRKGLLTATAAGVIAGLALSRRALGRAAGAVLFAGYCAYIAALGIMNLT
jgi:hypothetical protein